jgi:hypothetical protein
MLLKAIEYIKTNNSEAARKIISEIMMEQCIRLIMSKSNIRNRNEALSVYYDALLILCEQIAEGKFNYQGDAQFKGYLKTICMNKTKEYERIIKGGSYLIAPEDLNDSEVSDFEELYDEIRITEYEKKQNSGVEVSINELIGSFPVTVVEAFHTLKEKCKLLIILKYKMNLRHDELIDVLMPFYQIKNKDVSKVELQRCLKSLKEEVNNRLKQTTN